MKKKTEKKKSTKTRTVANRLDIIENVLKQIQERLYSKPRWSDRNCKCALDLPIPAWKAPTFQNGNRAHGEMPGAMDYSRYMKAVQECINSGSEVDRLNKNLEREKSRADANYSEWEKVDAENTNLKRNLEIGRGNYEHARNRVGELEKELKGLREENEILGRNCGDAVGARMQEELDKIKIENCKKQISRQRISIGELDEQVTNFNNLAIDRYTEILQLKKRIEDLQDALKTQASINGAIGKDNEREKHIAKVNCNVTHARDIVFGVEQSIGSTITGMGGAYGDDWQNRLQNAIDLMDMKYDVMNCDTCDDMSMGVKCEDCSSEITQAYRGKIEEQKIKELNHELANSKANVRLAQKTIDRQREHIAELELDYFGHRARSEAFEKLRRDIDGVHSQLMARSVNAPYEMLDRDSKLWGVEICQKLLQDASNESVKRWNAVAADNKWKSKLAEFCKS